MSSQFEGYPVVFVESMILNKPIGYVSATKDGRDKTVLDLVPEQFRWRNLFPAGRLDKNTTGMMLITDDRCFCT